MKSTVETLDPTKAKLTVEVEYVELQPAIEHAYSHIAQDISIPGFRKGKVPPRIIDQRVGRAAVLEHAINEGLPGFYRDAIAETKLRPLGQPVVDVTAVPAEDDESGVLVFTAEVEIRPEFDLPELAGLNIEVPNTEVTDEDVAEQLSALQARFGTLVGVDRPAATGDFVVLDLKAVIEDNEVDNVTGISYEIGTGNMLEGLDEALTGLSAGETTTFVAPLAGGEHAGQDIGEATAVQVGDFNFKAGTVSLVRAWKKAPSGRVLGTPKSKRSRRVAMIDGWAMDAFQKLAGDRPSDDLMFKAPRGGKIHPHRFNERQWHPTLEKTSIKKDLTPHSLRHTFASWQLMAGVPAQVVQFRLGHSDLSVTSKVYSHLLLEEQRSGAKVMNWEPAKEIEGTVDVP